MDKQYIGYNRWLLLAAAASVNLRMALIMALVTGISGGVLWCAVTVRKRVCDWPPISRLIGGIAIWLLIGAVRELMAGGTLYGYPLLPSAWPIFSADFSIGGMGLITAGILLGLWGMKLPLIPQTKTAKSLFWRRMHFAGRFAGVPRMLTTFGIAWMALAVWQ